MARKKVALSYIKNDTNRKASLRKRRKGLINKVREINTICGVEACAVIYSPPNPIPEVWPSPQQARDMLTGYLVVPEIDRSDKELDPMSFMRKRLRKTREKMERMHRENKRRDLNCFTYRCMTGWDSLDRLDMSDRGEMGRVINEVIWDIKNNMEQFLCKRSGNGQDASTPATAAMAPPPLPLAPPPPPPFVALVAQPLPPPLVAPVALPPPLVAPVAQPLPPPLVALPPLPLIEEESRNTSMMSLLMSPIEDLDWDLGDLPYPHLFNEWDNNEN